MKKIIFITLLAFTGFINAIADPIFTGWGCTWENEIIINSTNPDYYHYLPPYTLPCGTDTKYISAAGVKSHFAAKITYADQLFTTIQSINVSDKVIIPGNTWYNANVISTPLKVECGNNFYAVLCANGRIYGVGADLSNPVLGSNPIDTLDPWELDNQIDNFVDFTITKNNHPLAPGTLFGLTNGNQVYGIGSANFGVMTNTSTTYQLVANDVKAIAAGKTFFAYLTRNGQLYYNGSIQTGAAPVQNMSIDISNITIKSLTIENIKALAYSIIIQDNEGALYYVGYLPGTEDQGFSAVPVNISSMLFSDYSAGYNHVLAIEASSNKVFSFGENTNDKLGYTNSFLQFPSANLQSIPKEVPHVMSTNANGKLFAGWRQSYVLGSGNCTIHLEDVWTSLCICKETEIDPMTIPEIAASAGNIESIAWLAPGDLVPTTLPGLTPTPVNKGVRAGWFDLTVKYRNGVTQIFHIYISISRLHLSFSIDNNSSNGVELDPLPVTNIIRTCDNVFWPTFDACNPYNPYRAAESLLLDTNDGALLYDSTGSKVSYTPGQPISGLAKGDYRLKINVPSPFAACFDNPIIYRFKVVDCDQCNNIYYWDRGYGDSAFVDLTDFAALNPGKDIRVELIDENGAVVGNVPYDPKQYPTRITLLPNLSGKHNFTYRVYVDGEFKCGKTITVDDHRQIEPKIISISPNPANGEVELILNSEHNQSAQILLLNSENVSQKELFSGEIIKGENRFNFDLREVQSGSYKIAIETATGTTTANLSVIK